MSLKKIVDEIFTKFTDYKQPHQAVTQMSSLGSLSGDLYQDSKRFIYELLQNADDSALPETKTKVLIKLLGNTLIVAHTGKTFDERDVIGISDIGNGTKKDASDKTGYKGIGFKSVFGQSNKVYIYTNSELFRFDESYEHDWNPEWGGTKEEWEKENELQFKFPWPIIPIYTESSEINPDIWNFLEGSEFSVATIIELYKPEEVRIALSELAQKVEMYLFLKNVEEITFFNDTLIKITILETIEGEITIIVNGKEKVKFLKKTFIINVPQEVQNQLQKDKDVPDKIKHARKAEIVLTAKRSSEGFDICRLGERNLYAYLPTEEKAYEIPVLVNASFYLAATRESLHKDSIWNKWLMSQVPVSLIKWIADLVLTPIGSEAYTILPKKLNGNDGLITEYNKSLENAKKNVPFIKNSDDILLKTDQAILDMTFLSTTTFVGKVPIINYKKQTQNELDFAENPFPEDHSSAKLKTFGVSSFEWKDFPNMVVMTPAFKEILTLENNKLLIKYLKYQSLSEDNKHINDSTLKGWDFILDHRENIKAPRDLYFSEIDVTPEADSVSNFVHPELEAWLVNNQDVKSWLESLNIQEKSDATFLLKTIVPNAENYANETNTIEIIRKTSDLLRKGEIGLDVPPLLSKLKVLTTLGNLIAAEDCYFSDSYNPRLKIQELIQDDIFVSPVYITESNLEDLKTLFRYMGVKEGISLQEEMRKKKSTLITEGFLEAYFDQHKNAFQPFYNYFTPNEYSNLAKFNLLTASEGFEFSKSFWKDIITYTSVENIKKQATAFWGHTSKQGYITGDNVDNYMTWFVQNIPCIPGKDGACYIASEIFLNTDAITKVAYNYLPVFDGPDLSPDWRDFFKFKTKLELPDYLKILTAISANPDHTKTEQQKVIELILDDFPNYSSEDLESITAWGLTGYLSDTDGFYRSTKDLNFYIDGNSSDFGENYHFAYFNQSVINHSEFVKFLKKISVNIIKQSDFRIETDDISPAQSLTEKLEFIIPYWAQWRRSEAQGGFEQLLAELTENYKKYEFLQANELIITYGNHWRKKTTNYLSGKQFFVVSNWKKLSVYMSLGNQLCLLLNAPRLQEQLQFLLFSEPHEIEEYFTENGIGLPPRETIIEYNYGNNITHNQETTEVNKQRIIPSEFFHLSKADFDKLNYTKSIIERAVTNVIDYLRTLSEYECSNYFVIAESVIGGITKNGNEITVVARPSDRDFILLYYTSEFDVLEYVDAELWCEDGVNTPKQITLGQLLKKTGINRIPVRNIDVSSDDFDSLLTIPKSDELDFNAVPFVPQKIAQIISSFANTNGGTLIFGIKEVSSSHNEVVGLSNDFRINEITKKAISLLQPIPLIEHDWVKIAEKSVYMIRTAKAESDILLENRKYIRREDKTFVEKASIQSSITLNVPNFDKTIAIIIGIENYLPKNHIKRVKYANADCKKFKEMLINEFDVKEEEIYMLLNEEALKSSIEYDLRGLFHTLNENDRLIFYYVGHGFHNGMTNYLSTYDMHKSNIPATAVSLQSILIEPLQKSKCKNALIFIDACAQSFIDENERNHLSNIDEEELIILSQDFPTYSTFLSCHTGQSSYSSDTLQNGIWTYHLVKAMNGRVPEVIQNNNYITDRLLRDYLSNSVAEYAMRELKKEQNPKAILDSSYENVILELKAN